jgi:energy-coupling factor transporter ATP-binding protein EcfA2
LGYELGAKARSDGVIYATLNGSRLNPRILSEGERELMAMVVRLVGEHRRLDGVCLFVDEPESHLHPAALRKVLARLRSALGTQGQLWLATHSLSLLTELDRSELWLVQDGGVVHPSSRLLSLALRDLVGEAEHVDRLAVMVSEPGAWAAVQFTAQCLQSASVASYRKGDPQNSLISSVLREQAESATRIRVLDWGAGEGRLAGAIAQEPDLASRLTYSAFEPKHELHARLAEAMTSLSEIDARAATGITSTSTEVLQAGFDVVVLCNVLHEINPVLWSQILPQLAELLADEGILLIVEDQVLPEGEFAHEFGFLVMGPDELRVLIGASETELLVERPEPGDYADRLYAARISRRAALRVSALTTAEATDALRKRGTAEAHQLRGSGSGHDPKGARRLAFLAQQVLNATLAGDALRQ